MKRRLLAFEAPAPGRFRLLGILALLFIAGQLLAAAHVASETDYLLDHARSSCAACLAGSASDDPSLLTVTVEKPVLVISLAIVIAKADWIFSTPFAAASARAPPAA